VADQAGLNSRQRLENLAGALAVVPGGGRLLAGGVVVLVDDLMTTGASLAEAARAVRVALGEGAETEVTCGGSVRQGLAHGDAARGWTGAAHGTAGGVGDTAGRLGAAGVDAAADCACRVSGRASGACDRVVDGLSSEARRRVPGGGAGSVCGGAVAAVYGAASREGREERMARVTEEATRGMPGRPGMVAASAARDVVCAAVVAATPDSFEMNRN
jgi:hypothetical protein